LDGPQIHVRYLGETGSTDHAEHIS
jgi:hypothetical protein